MDLQDRYGLFCDPQAVDPLISVVFVTLHIAFVDELGDIGRKRSLCHHQTGCDMRHAVVARLLYVFENMHIIHGQLDTALFQIAFLDIEDVIEQADQQFIRRMPQVSHNIAPFFVTL